MDYLESQLTTRTRAIVVISPHNPTGAVASASQLDDLAAIASRHRLAIIADEVFSEFLFDLDELPRPAKTNAPLVFTLNGFSKMLALPGLKLGWMAVSGEPSQVQRAIRALEMISDTFLPVNEVIQFAVPELFRMGENFLLGYQETIRQCRSVALKSLSNCHELSLIPPAGGFYLTASLTGAVHDEEQWVIDLLERCGVLVHPGYFYEIPGIHFVMSFVHESGALEQACRSILSSLRSDNRQHMKNEDASVPPKTQN
jgi:aspartate/methionine/tyrosine aminotransferase